MSQYNLSRKVPGLLKQKETSLKEATEVNQYVRVGLCRRCMTLNPKSAESRRDENIKFGFKKKKHSLYWGTLLLDRISHPS